ncbi:PAS domain-containing protein [Seleniivibrio sp.]|uniref:PAS domain-containing protein n=1 Tax=Seleniivibrio sp. TaxID=2898801 RepID=UPI0025E7E04E|nr:PAS domain-containing protein [Seleniivibrio sp.]MCD8552741.1 PAS domain-containing protein [Seleniivibrio sp.]
MNDVKAMIERLKKELDLLGDNPQQEDVSAVITEILGCRGCDISCFMTDSDVFQTMLDTIPVPVYYKNTTGRYLACNKALCEAYGFARTDIVGKTAYDFFPKDVADSFAVGDKALIHDASEERLEHRGRFPGMEDSFHIIHKRAFKRNGNVEGIIGVILDMTEIKKVEDTAWASEAFFKTLFETAPMPIVIINGFNMIMDMNSSAAQMFDPVATVPGQEISSLFRYHSDFEKVMSADGGAIRVEILGSAGVEEVVAMVSSNVLNGEICYAFAFIRTDI